MKNIVVIGGGLGGLTSAALLAQDGYNVTLLEQHSIVGGCATTFRRKGFICEVGLHEMDGVYTNPQIKKIFDKLDVYKHVEMLKAPEFFKVTTKNGSFVMPDGLEESKKALIEKFPNEEAGVIKYFDILKQISDTLAKIQALKWYEYLIFPLIAYPIIRYRDKTVTEVFANLFEDEELKLILNTNVQYYNDTPDTLSFLLYCVAQYSYYRGGGYFIKGGSGRLSDYLASVITQNGGSVITKANVTACTPTSVSYEYKKESITITADTIISNLSPSDTYALFDIPYQESREIASSLLTTYIGFSKNIKEVYGVGAYSNFFYDDIASVAEFNSMIKKDLTERGFVFVDYSQIDAALTKDPHKSFGAVCMTDFLEEWEGLSPEAYKAKKLELEATIVKKLEVHYPELSKYIEYIETGTAKTVQRYIKTPNATAYGYKPTPKQFFKIPQVKSKKIDNLYFVGQWVIAGGFSPAISSGYMCYEKIKQEI